MARRPWAVHWYYDVWTRPLEGVRQPVRAWGHCPERDGYARVASLPPLQADDLASSLAFAPHEHAIAAEAQG